MVVETNLSHWDLASRHATEGQRLARETGQNATARYLVAMLAWLTAQQSGVGERRIGVLVL
jgi:hypothetical protein